MKGSRHIENFVNTDHRKLIKITFTGLSSREKGIGRGCCEY